MPKIPDTSKCPATYSLIQLKPNTKFVLISHFPKLGPVARVFYAIRHHIRQFGRFVAKKCDLDLGSTKTVQDLFNKTVKGIKWEIYDTFDTTPTLYHAVELLKQVERGTKDREFIKSKIIKSINNKANQLQKSLDQYSSKAFPDVNKEINNEIKELKKYIPQITSKQTQKKLREIQTKLEKSLQQVLAYGAIEVAVNTHGIETVLSNIEKLIGSSDIRNGLTIDSKTFKVNINQQILLNAHTELMSRLATAYSNNPKATESEGEALLKRLNRYPNVAHNAKWFDINGRLNHKIDLFRKPREKKEIATLVKNYNDNIFGLELELGKQKNSRVYVSAYIQLIEKNILELNLHGLLAARAKILQSAHIPIDNDSRTSLLRKLEGQIAKQPLTQFTKQALDAKDLVNSYFGRRISDDIDKLKTLVQYASEIRQQKENLKELYQLSFRLNPVVKTIHKAYLSLSENLKWIEDICTGAIEKALDTGLQGRYRHLGENDRIELKKIAKKWDLRKNKDLLERKNVYYRHNPKESIFLHNDFASMHNFFKPVDPTPSTNRDIEGIRSKLNNPNKAQRNHTRMNQQALKKKHTLLKKQIQELKTKKANLTLRAIDVKIKRQIDTIKSRYLEWHIKISKPKETQSLFEVTNNLISALTQADAKRYKEQIALLEKMQDNLMEKLWQAVQETYEKHLSSLDEVGRYLSKVDRYKKGKKIITAGFQNPIEVSKNNLNRAGAKYILKCLKTSLAFVERTLEEGIEKGEVIYEQDLNAYVDKASLHSMKNNFKILIEFITVKLSS